MDSDLKILPPQPTESEAIVAAMRESQTPETPLVPPVSLPIDIAKQGSLPAGIPESH